MKDSNHLLLENQLCFSTYALSRAIIKRYRPFLDEIDLTYPQYLVMLVMWEKESITMKELCDRVLLDTGTLTPLVKKLEKMSLITRCRSTLDERVLLLALTTEGKLLKEKAKDIPFKVFKSIGAPVDELLTLKEQSDILLHHLSKL